ncbi:MAG TPA: molybdopterin-guanine dinucleotide biosynthesis protein A [Stellaceae bacterium]|jgi:hypothetical protein|nr:molybdopterin-guanine dinucleotide biosynthesis protein A [Stellaceae bacterium]
MLHRVLLIALLVLVPAVASAATGGEPAVSNAAESRHEGYYYPKITTREVYKARTKPLPKMDRHERLLFVSATTQQQGAATYAPRYVVFAKGDEAEKLIIVGLDDQTLGTIYRARALLAALSSLARLTPLLRDADLEDTLTFYDLARLMGFTQITISDGRTHSHRVTLK